jgi:hypothetical protein
LRYLCRLLQVWQVWIFQVNGMVSSLEDDLLTTKATVNAMEFFRPRIDSDFYPHSYQKESIRNTCVIVKCEMLKPSDSAYHKLFQNQELRNRGKKYGSCKERSCNSPHPFLHYSWLMFRCSIGYSDFHNLMGFTSKKMPNTTQISR